MKMLLIAALAAAAFGLATPQAKACSYRRVTYCAPYKVRTCEVSCCNYKRTGYDQCGYSYFYYVTVVTYRDYFSNGSTLTYTRTYRA